MNDLVESACDLAEALDRVKAARKAWRRYAGNPTPEIAYELLDASEAVRLAVVVLAGDKP